MLSEAIAARFGPRRRQRGGGEKYARVLVLAFRHRLAEAGSHRVT